MVCFVYTCSYNRQPLSALQKDVWVIGKVEVKHLPNSELRLLNAHFNWHNQHTSTCILQSAERQCVFLLHAVYASKSPKQLHCLL